MTNNAEHGITKVKDNAVENKMIPRIIVVILLQRDPPPNFVVF